MRSGTGRHRRPRQAPAIFVTAGVTSAGIALPLLGAAGAHAADADTWDRVAQCESGGIWSANTGNGYYGGLQLTQQIWEDHGGRDYAPRPDLASRAEQIVVAEKILAAKGREAWPGCATKARLTEDGEAPDVNPGILGVSPGESGAQDRSSASDGGLDRGDGDSAQRQSPKGGGHSRELSTDADGSGKGRHRGPSDGEARGGGLGNSGRHASRGGNSERTGGLGAGGYTVQPGDNLSEIADTHSVSGGWSVLYGSNKDVLGSDPDVIRPGQHIDLERPGR
jgi:hypothetical protein